MPVTPLSPGGVGTLPNVESALYSWYQPMVFSVVTKATVNFQVVETTVDMNCMGVMQPLTAQRLLLKPEGQRGWVWFSLHADDSLVLNLDDEVTYLGVKYRVMAKSDFTAYGYAFFELVSDYTA